MRDARARERPHKGLAAGVSRGRVFSLARAFCALHGGARVAMRGARACGQPFGNISRVHPTTGLYGDHGTAYRAPSALLAWRGRAMVHCVTVGHQGSFIFPGTRRCILIGVHYIIFVTGIIL